MENSKNELDKFYTTFLQAVEKNIPEHYFQKHLSNSKTFDLFENSQFKELLRHSPAIVGVFNNITMGYEFMSDNIEALTGYPPSFFRGSDGMRNVLYTFQPRHAEIYTQHIFPTIYEYFNAYKSTNEIKKFKFTASFQLVKKDGSIIWCMQQLNVIETDDEGLPLLVFMFMSDITHIKKDSSVDFIITLKDENNVFQHVHATTFNEDKTSIDFTRRELEILQLLCKGKSSSEISKILFISENTVSKHRQNMLEKSSMKSTAELVSYVLGKGFVK